MKVEAYGVAQVVRILHERGTGSLRESLLVLDKAWHSCPNPY